MLFSLKQQNKTKLGSEARETLVFDQRMDWYECGSRAQALWTGFEWISRALSEDEGWGSFGAVTIAPLPAHTEHWEWCLCTQPLPPPWMECRAQHMHTVLSRISEWLDVRPLHSLLRAAKTRLSTKESRKVALYYQVSVSIS